jgi:hypothetical protein
MNASSTAEPGKLMEEKVKSKMYNSTGEVVNERVACQTNRENFAG